MLNICNELYTSVSDKKTAVEFTSWNIVAVCYKRGFKHIHSYFLIAYSDFKHTIIGF